MQCAETHNSTWATAVRAAARQGRLSHALILTGEGDKRSAARYIAAAPLPAMQRLPQGDGGHPPRRNRGLGAGA